MSEIEFRVCMEGPKCSEKYRIDYEARVKERGSENQGTGNLCTDLENLSKDVGIEINVLPSICLDQCPIPGERSSVIAPDGKLHRAYFDDLPELIDNFK